MTFPAPKPTDKAEAAYWVYVRWAALYALVLGLQVDDVARQRAYRAETTAALCEIKARLPEPPGFP